MYPLTPYNYLNLLISIVVPPLMLLSVGASHGRAALLCSVGCDVVGIVGEINLAQRLVLTSNIYEQKMHMGV